MKIKFVLLTMIVLLFSGCGVGSVVALPFKAVGAAVNVVTPDIVGDTISGVGEAADSVIPF